MAIKLQDYLAKRPAEEQRAVEARASQLIEEEATLRQLREALSRSQQELAERLHVKQAAVSKLERRTDMYISTLRALIHAMGGELEVVARFPDRAPVRITQFRTMKAEVVSDEK